MSEIKSNNKRDIMKKVMSGLFVGILIASVLIGILTVIPEKVSAETRNIRLLAPNGGETLTAGSTFDIKWMASGSGGYVTLRYSTDGGATYHRIDCVSNPVTITKYVKYAWTVPNVDSRIVRVKITWVSSCTGTAIVWCSDESDGNFAIFSPSPSPSPEVSPSPSPEVSPSPSPEVSPSPSPEVSPSPSPEVSPSPSPEVSPSPSPIVTTPSAPQNLKATEGDCYVNLSWSAPGDDGGSPITEYKIYRGTSSGSESPRTFVSANTTSYNDTAVTNNLTYYYKVHAVNSAGEGAEFADASATPISVAPPTPPHPWWKSWLVPVLIVIAVIAIALIVVYLLWRKRGREEEEKKEEKKEERRRFCMHCGASMSVGAKFCPNCGEEPIKGGGEVKVCKNCGAAIPIVAKFCRECGAAQLKD